MKKYFNFVLSFLVIGCLFINHVQAESTKTTENRTITTSGNSQSSSATTTSQHQNSSSNEHPEIPFQKYADYHLIFAKNTDSRFYAHWDANYKNIPLYCLDAVASGMQNLYAARFLLDTERVKPGGALNEVYYHDLSVMHILINGAHTMNNSYLYMSTSFAMRAMNAVWGFDKIGQVGNTGSTEIQNALSAAYHFFGLAYQWITEDAETRANFDILQSNFSTVKLSTLEMYKDYTITVSGNDAGYQSILNQARDLFKGALREAASEVTKAKQGSATIEVNESIAPTKQILKTENTETIVWEKRYQFTLKNFTNDSSASFSLDRLTFVNDAGTYLTNLDFVETRSQPKITKITLNGTSIYTTNQYNGNFQYGINLLNSLYVRNAGITIDYSKDIQFEVTVEIIGDSKISESDKKAGKATLTCQTEPKKFSFEYSYNDRSLSSSLYSDWVGTVWYAADDMVARYPYTVTQRFVSLEKASGSTTNTDSKKGQVTTEARLLDCDNQCTSLVEECNKTGNMNSAACKSALEKNCINESCMTIRIACEAGNNNECVRYQEICAPTDCEWLKKACDIKGGAKCEEYQKVCKVSCDTTVASKFQCCSEEGSASTLLVSDTDNKTIDIKGPENMTACFVDGIKKQGTDKGYKGANIYDDTGVNTYVMDSNKYCAISCKEDYVFNLPQSQIVNAGGYFTFKAAVSGTKTCVTNKLDREQFNKDLIEIQKEMVSAYQEYAKWKALYNGHMGTITDTYTSSCACGSGRNCGPHCSTSTYDKKWHASGTVSDWPVIGTAYQDSGILTITTTTRYVEDDVFNLDKDRPTGLTTQSCSDTYSCGRYACGSYDCHCRKCNCEDCGCDGDGANCSSCCDECCDTCTEYCTEYCTCSGSKSYYTSVRNVNSESTYKQKLKSKMDQAASVLAAAQKKYDNALKEYQSCMNWTMSINFDPELTYDYQEDYYQKFDDMGKMDKYSQTTGNKEEWYCSANLVGTDYSKCSTADKTTNVTNSHAFTFCDTSGCSRNKSKSVQNIPEAIYKKVTQSASASYQPITKFYNKYSTGSIITRPEVSTKLEENKLPVKLGTERGIYTYSIQISNVGEFYNLKTDNLGRIAGSDHAVLNTSELKNKVNYSNGNINYNCSYLVNMGKVENDTLACVFDTDPNCNSGSCDFECVGEGCNRYCSSTNCDFECVGIGCVYDNNEGSYIYQKQISLNNMFPDGQVALNWDNEKGKQTVSQIEGQGSAIYNQTPVLSVTIDPNARKQITQYNKDRDYSYTDESISCYDFNGYENVACYSSFISELLDGDLGDIQVNDSKLKNENLRVTADDAHTDYFKTWGATDYWSMAGPSWQ